MSLLLIFEVFFLSKLQMYDNTLNEWFSFIFSVECWLVFTVEISWQVWTVSWAIENTLASSSVLTPASVPLAGPDCDLPRWFITILHSAAETLLGNVRRLVPQPPTAWRGAGVAPQLASHRMIDTGPGFGPQIIMTCSSYRGHSCLSSLQT